MTIDRDIIVACNAGNELDACQTCSIEGCGEPLKARGWCNTHWKRWRRNGDPLLTTRTPRGETIRWLIEVALPYSGNECLIWPFYRNNFGYGQIGIDGRIQLAHRVVCQRTYGPPPTQKHAAAHNCGNGHLGCVSPRHLQWKTYAENQADRLIHETHNRGSRNGQAKLTEEDVREIRKLVRSNTQRAIASMFGVTDATMSAVVNGKTWSWVDDNDTQEGRNHND